MLKSAKRTLYMLSGTLKGVFFVLIIFTVIGIVLYAQKLVGDLREESRDIVEFYAETIQRIGTSDIDSEALGWAFTNITERIDFPIILTDSQGNPTGWRGLNIETGDRSPEAIAEIKKLKIGRASCRERVYCEV